MYAAHEARLNKPVKDGQGTVRSHLESAAIGGNKQAMKRLEPPPFPEPLEYLWNAFLKLHCMRSYDMNGPQRFTPLHIKAGCELFGWSFEPYEIDTLVELDIATLHPESVEVM